MPSYSDRCGASWHDDPAYISNGFCKNIVLAYSYTSIMVSLNIAVVVVLRCWALYDRKPWVLKFLVSFLMLMILPCVYVVTKQANDNLYPIVTLPEILPGCIVVYSSYAWIPYTFALCFESMVFSMMLHRTYVITQKYGNTRLIWRLMIDGTLYYVAAIAAVIFCLGAAVSDSLRAPVISSGLLVSILSTMCSRMILSLHNFTEQEQLERLGTSGVAPAPVFSSSLKVATSDIYEERFKKLEYERSTDHERTSFKFDGGADDYSQIEMNVLRVSDRIGINV
ncbi:putative transmembrane protein [Rhizoctonia solani 123E]|uniref:Putative transmembrane protein n=1 Tax=Rhizoctonia solani 123E TaxID=1423351 RepID=A0A074S2Y8_9AGAM|nr:putative transmembrane protein [Rhizoctonia solani 123E]